MQLDQPDLLSWTPPNPLPIGGVTYDAERDGKRLGDQAQRVFDLMKSGQWFTPEDLESRTGYRWASINARIRDFRKPAFKIPGHVEREGLGGGNFKYRLVMKQ